MGDSTITDKHRKLLRGKIYKIAWQLTYKRKKFIRSKIVGNASQETKNLIIKTYNLTKKEIEYLDHLFAKGWPWW